LARPPDAWLWRGPQREQALPRHAFIPFGGGPRICIGNHFAVMEAQLVLATWLRSSRFELSDSAPPRFEPLFTLRPLGGIQMTVSKRERRGTGSLLSNAASG
jgi:cytochrome P450